MFTNRLFRHLATIAVAQRIAPATEPTCDECGLAAWSLCGCPEPHITPEELF